MQRSLLRGQSGTGCFKPARCYKPFGGAHPSVKLSAATNGNGNAHGSVKAAVPSQPSPAETARTVVSLVNEGTLSTASVNGVPIGTPVSYSLDKQGHLKVHLDSRSLELQNLHKNSSCSLLVQAAAMPARAVGAVALVGKVDVSTEGPDYSLQVDSCLYFGGLDQSLPGQEVSASDYQAAEPDVLRSAAADLVATWNNERAEDIYRIVSDFLGVPLTDMLYAELLWLDRLGMYVRSEVPGSEPQIVRVPFYRPILDERDARSVITMAAQTAWEKERNYTPPLPSMFAEAANN